MLTIASLLQDDYPLSLHYCPSIDLGSSNFFPDKPLRMPFEKGTTPCLQPLPPRMGCGNPGNVEEVSGALRLSLDPEISEGKFHSPFGSMVSQKA